VNGTKRVMTPWVVSLPMRDGNNENADIIDRKLKVVSLPMRDGNIELPQLPMQVC